MRILRPASKWARITVWLGGLSLLLWLVDLAPGAKLGGWATLVTLIFLLLCRGPALPLGLPPSALAAAQPIDRHLPLYRRYADPAALAHVRPGRAIYSPASSPPMSPSPTCIRSCCTCKRPMMRLPRSYFPWRPRGSSMNKSQKSSPGLPMSGSPDAPLLCREAERVSSSPPKGRCWQRGRRRFPILSTETSPVS